MTVNAAECVTRCLAAAAAAAKAAALTPDEDITGMPVFDPATGEVNQTRALKWLAWVSGGVKGSQTEAEAASAAFLCEMPPLVSRAHTKAFIACVAAGLGHKYLTPVEAKSLMYSAQLALAAFRPRARQQPPPTPSPSGRDESTMAAAEILRAQNRGKR